MKPVLAFAFCVCFAHTFCATFPSFEPQNNSHLYAQTPLYVVLYYVSFFAACVVHNVYRINAESSALMHLLWTQATLVVIAGVADRDLVTWCLVLVFAVYFFKK